MLCSLPNHCHAEREAEQTQIVTFKSNSPPLFVSHTDSSALAGGSGAFGGGGAAFWLLGGFLGFGKVAGTGAEAGAGAWARGGLETLGFELVRGGCHRCCCCCCCWEMLMA